MFCSKCGKEISDTTKYCPNCGTDCSAEGNVKSAVNGVFQSTEQEISNAARNIRDSFTGNVVPQYTGERLQDDRGLLSYILLSIITCGIYSYYFIYKMAHDVNIACDGDGETTSGLVAFICLSIITCGIYTWIWYYKLGNRLASNAQRYGLNFQENGTSVLLWQIFGVFLCGIGPFIAMHILIKNTNRICNAYNRLHRL